MYVHGSHEVGFIMVFIIWPQQQRPKNVWEFAEKM